MSEDVEESALALVDLVLVPLSIPAGAGHGSRVQRVGLLPLLVLLPLLPCCIWSVCESETHTLRLTMSGRAKHKKSLRSRSTGQSGIKPSPLKSALASASVVSRGGTITSEPTSSSSGT